MIPDCRACSATAPSPRRARWPAWSTPSANTAGSDCKRVMAPAIKLARRALCSPREEAKELTDPTWPASPTRSASFSATGSFYKDGEIFRQPELARHAAAHRRRSRRLLPRQDGARACRRSEEGRRAAHARRPGPVQRGRARRRSSARFHDYTVISAPPPSSGGIVLLSALNILEGYDLARLGDRTAASMHLIAEAFRRAYMDRADYLGDPDYNTIPGGRADRQKIRRRLARRHPRRCGHAQRHAGRPGGLSARRAQDRRPAHAPSRTTPRTTPLWTAKATPSPSPPRSTTPSART